MPLSAIAIYHEAAARGIHPQREPQVGNFAWEIFFADPDGYKINFSSPIDLPEKPSSHNSKPDLLPTWNPASSRDSA